MAGTAVGAWTESALAEGAPAASALLPTRAGTAGMAPRGIVTMPPAPPVVVASASATVLAEAGSSASSFSFGTPASVASTACVSVSPSSNHAATAMLRAISRTNIKRSSMVALGTRWACARSPVRTGGVRILGDIRRRGLPIGPHGKTAKDGVRHEQHFALEQGRKHTGVPASERDHGRAAQQGG